MHLNRFFSSARVMGLAFVVATGLLGSSSAIAKDWYVNVGRGKGKKGTKKKPAKQLGNIIKKLKPGDTIHMAEGVYEGKGKNGTAVIKVPVSIIGGYSDDFSTRDPWGKHKTILTGDNMSKNWKATPRVFIDLNLYRKKEMPKMVFDGLIIDHAPRNRYKTDKQHEIIRKANPKTGQMPTPDMGALKIVASKTGNFQDTWDITVRNCVVMNAAPTQGALSVSAYADSKVLIENNLIVNNTGVGIFVGSKYAGEPAKAPMFEVKNNTVLFTWKYDGMASSFSGNSIEFDNMTRSNVHHNVFGFADRNGVENIRKARKLTLAHNIIVGNKEADYNEFQTRIALADVEDEAEELTDESEGNISPEIKVPVSKEWATLYASRILIDRNKAEADVKVSRGGANALRSMLGLPVQGSAIKGSGSPVWLPRIAVDDAMKAGEKAYKGKYGCAKANAK